jgi:putative two-component system response regulator
MTSPGVLIVDDEPQNRQLLGAMLSVLGVGWETAEDGFEALARLHPGIDLVLLDVMMPGLDGFEVARRIRANPLVGDVPILMVTALAGKPERLRAVEAGANDFITKPVDMTELRVRVSSLLKVKAAQDLLKRHHEELETLVVQRTAALSGALELAHECQLETIRRLAIAAESRDPHCAHHLRRVSRYSASLGRRLGLPEPEVERLGHASTLHDVGKIAIPQSILLKPGNLDAAELTQMQQHTLIGAQILSDSRSPYLQMGETIALTHHEKWDGSGYPQGLRGEQIPLAGRICAVADVFDALTTERAYKPAFSVATARRLLEEGKGSHFEPRLVELFLEGVPDEGDTGLPPRAGFDCDALLAAESRG